MCDIRDSPRNDSEAGTSDPESKGYDNMALDVDGTRHPPASLDQQLSPETASPPRKWDPGPIPEVHGGSRKSAKLKHHGYVPYRSDSLDTRLHIRSRARDRPLMTSHSMNEGMPVERKTKASGQSLNRNQAGAQSCDGLLRSYLDHACDPSRSQSESVLQAPDKSDPKCNTRLVSEQSLNSNLDYSQPNSCFSIPDPDVSRTRADCGGYPSDSHVYIQHHSPQTPERGTGHVTAFRTRSGEAVRLDQALGSAQLCASAPVINLPMTELGRRRTPPRKVSVRLGKAR